MAQNSGTSAKRRGPGKPFQKGQSGNPGGRPREIAEVKELARAHSEAAIEALVDVMQNSNSPAARVSAATAILDRGFGKPTQAIEQSVADERPLPELSWDELQGRLERLTGRLEEEIADCDEQQTAENVPYLTS